MDRKTQYDIAFAILKDATLKGNLLPNIDWEVKEPNTIDITVCKVDRGNVNSNKRFYDKALADWADTYVKSVDKIPLDKEGSFILDYEKAEKDIESLYYKNDLMSEYMSFYTQEEIYNIIANAGINVTYKELDDANIIVDKYTEPSSENDPHDYYDEDYDESIDYFNPLFHLDKSAISYALGERIYRERAAYVKWD